MTQNNIYYLIIDLATILASVYHRRTNNDPSLFLNLFSLFNFTLETPLAH